MSSILKTPPINHNLIKNAPVPSIGTSQKNNLATNWREIQGSNNWNNLLTPLNPLLQSELIRYGELVSACYKAFDLDPSSKRYLHCKYGKKSMLASTRTAGGGKYQVTKYVYATPDICISMQPDASVSRWIGYVMVSEEGARLGRRDICTPFMRALSIFPTSFDELKFIWDRKLIWGFGPLFGFLYLNEILRRGNKLGRL